MYRSEAGVLLLRVNVDFRYEARLWHLGQAHIPGAAKKSANSDAALLRFRVNDARPICGGSMGSWGLPVGLLWAIILRIALGRWVLCLWRRREGIAVIPARALGTVVRPVRQRCVHSADGEGRYRRSGGGGASVSANARNSTGQKQDEDYNAD